MGGISVSSDWTSDGVVEEDEQEDWYAIGGGTGILYSIRDRKRERALIIRFPSPNGGSKRRSDHIGWSREIAGSDP